MNVARVAQLQQACKALMARPQPAPRFARLLGFAPDTWQQRFLESSHDRILLNCCRQSGKSTVASVLALHTAFYRPESLSLLISPGQRQSAELFRKVTHFYEAAFGGIPKVEDNRLSLRLLNGSRIVSLPANESTVRGYSGVTLLLEDEAAFVPDELHTAVKPMLMVSRGKHVMMSTPHGRRGHFYEAYKGDEWEKYKVTTHDCPRHDPVFREREKREMGEWWYKQEYECEFMETIFGLFRTEDVDKAISEDVEPL